MSHYSPLKKLFRKQKALAGINRLMDAKKQPQTVLVMAKPFYFYMSPRDYKQNRETIAKLMEDVGVDLPQAADMVR